MKLLLFVSKVVNICPYIRVTGYKPSKQIKSKAILKKEEKLNYLLYTWLRQANPKFNNRTHKSNFPSKSHLIQWGTLSPVFLNTLFYN